MKFKVDGWNNFCRVFELPLEYSEQFCFGGGHSTNFQMVDWFNPVQGVGTAACDKEVDYDELVASLTPWLIEKNYVKPDRKYLVICEFGAAFIFNHKIPE